MNRHAYTPEERAAIYKVIYERRDIRSFLPDPLDEETVSRILDAAHQAPSVGFMQPWNFILIQSQELKEKLHDAVERERIAASLHFEDEQKDQYLKLKVEGILEAPLTICVTNDPTRGGRHVIGRNSIPETDVFSVSCAIQNMWLASRAEGIAMGWVSIFKKSDIRYILDIPPHVDPIGLISLGYTKEFPKRPLLEAVGWRQRIPLQELVYREKWGNAFFHASL